MTRPRSLLWVAVGAFALGMSALSVLQQRAFETGRFDVGNLTQVVWSTANGRFLEMTDVNGEQISRLGAHFDPIVVVLAPLWWIWPSPDLLLVAQAVAVALGAIPVYLLARKHLGSDRGGLVFAVGYLLYPPTQWLVVDDFHPVAFATPLLLAAIWFLDEDRLLPFAVCAGAACLSKEQIGLVVAMLGLWYAVAHGRKRAGALIFGAGTLIAVVATAVVVPAFAPGEGSPFAERYASVGGSPAGIVRGAFEHPVRLVQALTEHRDLTYLLDLLAPLGGLSLLSPLLAATALPEVALNMLSDTPTQTSIHFHYTAGAIPGLVAAAVFGGARIRRRWPAASHALGLGLVLLVLGSGVVLGPLPIWAHVPFGSTLAADDHVVTAHDRAAARVLEVIPPDVPVSATNNLGAHLSERKRIFSFPVIREATWIAVDLTRPSYRDNAPGRGFALAYARLRRSGEWTVVRQDDGVIVLRKTASSSGGLAHRIDRRDALQAFLPPRGSIVDRRRHAAAHGTGRVVPLVGVRSSVATAGTPTGKPA